MVLQGEAPRARGGGLQGALRQGEGGGHTSHFLPPLLWVASGRGTGKRPPGCERARDRAPGAGFRVCFYLAMGGAARAPRFSPDARSPPRARRGGTGPSGRLASGGPRVGETQSRGDPAGPKERRPGRPTQGS